MRKISLIILFFLFILLLLWIVFHETPKENISFQSSFEQNPAQEISRQENVTVPTAEQNQEQIKEPPVQAPLDNWQDRITKKPFGIFINPKTSPVQPEKFRGWHTGTDFEIFENETEQKVEVRAICNGEITQKKYVNGYGGVIIQNCSFENELVTILYGHLNIQNSPDTGKQIFHDQVVGQLADNQSYYSDGERKHLHLGIHKGKDIDLRGYVQTENQLKSWLNFEEIQDFLN